MTTIPSDNESANGAMRGIVSNQVFRWAATLAPPNTPVSTLTRVMPT